MTSQGSTPLGQPPLVCAVPAPTQRRCGGEIAIKNKSCFLTVGITEVVLGVLCIGIGTSVLYECNYDSMCNYRLTAAASGIWGGALAIVFGSSNLVLVYKPTPRKITTNRVMSSLGILTSVTMMVIEVAAARQPGLDTALIPIHSVIATFSSALIMLFICNVTYFKMGHGCCACPSQEETGSQMVAPSGSTGTSEMIAVSNIQLVVVQGESSETSQTMMTSLATDSAPRHKEALSSSTGGGGVVNQDFCDDLPNKDAGEDTIGEAFNE